MWEIVGEPMMKRSSKHNIVGYQNIFKLQNELHSKWNIESFNLETYISMKYYKPNL
jgi:hypothetical protein